MHVSFLDIMFNFSVVELYSRVNTNTNPMASNSFLPYIHLEFYCNGFGIFLSNMQTRSYCDRVQVRKTDFTWMNQNCSWSEKNIKAIAWNN